jgi:DNA-binding MarR family transcriptional regulator
MNKIAPTGKRAAPARRSPPTGPSFAPQDAAVHEQALRLDSIFKALARYVLVDDDPAAELPLGQFRVCLALFESPRSMTGLSRELGVSQSAITQIADRLQAAGMVNRLPGGDDRRVRSLQLTTRAKNILQLRADRRIARVMEILKSLSADARQSVLAALSALGEACNDS